MNNQKLNIQNYIQRYRGFFQTFLSKHFFKSPEASRASRYHSSSGVSHPVSTAPPPNQWLLATGSNNLSSEWLNARHRESADNKLQVKCLMWRHSHYVYSPTSRDSLLFNILLWRHFVRQLYNSLPLSSWRHRLRAFRFRLSDGDMSGYTKAHRRFDLASGRPSRDLCMFSRVSLCEIVASVDSSSVALD